MKEFIKFLFSRWILVLIYLALVIFISWQVHSIVLGVVLFSYFIYHQLSNWMDLNLVDDIKRYLTFMEEVNQMGMNTNSIVRVLLDLTDASNKNIYLLQKYLLSKGLDWDEFSKFCEEKSSEYKSYSKILEDGLHNNNEQSPT